MKKYIDLLYLHAQYMGLRARLRQQQAVAQSGVASARMDMLSQIQDS